jgi:two-component system, NarL family, sensor histidine kinase UhpB
MPGNEDQFALVMVEDIGDQKKVERKFCNYQEKLRSVALDLSLAEEGERQRLATGFHDHVGQILSLAQIKLGVLRQAHTTNLTETIDEIRQLIGQTIRDIRSLNSELSPPILHELGFVAAVEWLGNLIQEKYGINSKVSVDLSPKPLTDEIQILLFHLVRELLEYIVKGSRPNNINIQISRDGSNIVVKIENDGFAADLDAESPLPSPYGLGLFGIRERLYHLGGSLEVESEQGLGTRISMAVPLEWHQKNWPHMEQTPPG